MHKYKDDRTQFNDDFSVCTSSNKQITTLVELLNLVAAEGYRFITVTPHTHERFLLNFNGVAKNLEDVFGWNLPFKANILSPTIFRLMSDGDLLFKGGEFFRSKIRISSLDNDLFLHSHFPTNEANAVFFGPDTYRFSRFVKYSLKLFQSWKDFSRPNVPVKILDVGCGSGAGGVAAVRALPKHQSYELNLNDLNPIAIDYACACTQIADIPAIKLYGDFFNIKAAEFDLIISNPPYLSDPAARLYRNGGSDLGLELSLRIAKHALDILAPGGHFILYTGMAITSSDNNPLVSGLMSHLTRDKFKWSYEEIDPDIFSEELDQPDYKTANRIAAVGLTVTRIK